MNIRFLTIAMLAAGLTVGCSDRTQKDQTVYIDPIEAEEPADEEATAEAENTEEEPSYFDLVAETPAAPAPAPKPRPAAKKTAKPSKAETIYVETDGAQGRVWGHVTMQGDRGSGTIHDWDENTLTVSVTRHGNELFAVDQNSRQYVFKLRK